MNFLRKTKNIIETNKLLSHIFDLFAATPIYKNYINHSINQYQKYIKQSKRYNIIIETSNICNAKCIMCPHPQMKRPRVVMSDIVFDTIIKKLLAEKIKPLAFIINGFGEPFTDKKIISRIKIIKKKFPQSKIKIYSNLSLPNKNELEELINSGLDEINISFNGYDKESYENTMKIKYQQSYNNLKTLISLNKKLGHKIIIRISSTLVATNDKEASKFIKKWENVVNSVSVNKAHNYNKTVDNQAKKYQINYKKTNIFPCKYIFNSIVFGVTGDIFLCCLDYEGAYNFGNIQNSKILDTFYSEKYQKIRQQHLKRDLSKMPICQNCYTPYKNGTEWLIKELY